MMNEKKYVNAIAKKIRCSEKRKKEIKKQLLTDMQMRIKQGEELSEIISRMGTAREIADGFNEEISADEQKRYGRNKVLKRVILAAAVLIFVGGFGYWILPKTAEIGQSGSFQSEQVEAAMKETVELLDAEDYEALQESAIPQMKTMLNAELRTTIREPFSVDWGERKQFGAAYLMEISQMGSRFAVGEMTVAYENVSVTYRLTYDKEMRLAGIYVR
ncbi:MAG: DUF3887 domain-containing protein [Bacteroidales bacterium]|nr:DUF3887 domain-containing protein [Bacteroidales bacterium]MCM1415157.1 DUF3887 domain-containing protein [bacterium]MCM1423383.1 DUF3887 domain-containing protein [bacterium]